MKTPNLTLTALFICSVAFAVHAHAQEPQLLRYHLDTDEQVHYRVNIVFNSPVETHTMSGVISYTGVSHADDQLTLRFSGGLKETKRSQGGSRFGGPGRFGRRPGGPPPGLFGGGGITFNGLKQTKSQIVIHPNGDVVSIKAQSQIPYLLGNLSLLPFESLADDKQLSWQSGNGITVTEQNDSSFSRSPFRQTTKTVKTGGSELSRYNIEKVEGDLVTVHKHYELNSPKVSKDDQEIQIEGEGTFVFNRKLSMPESLQAKYKFRVDVGGTEVSIPLNINYTRLSEEEFSNIQKKNEFAKNNPGINTQGDPWTEEVQQNIIKELQSDNVHTVQRRLVRLSARLPFYEEKAVAEALYPLLSKGGQTGKMAGMAWRRWKVIVPELEEKRAAAAAEKKAAEMKAAETKPAAENPFETAEKKPAAKLLRTWVDATGKFKIEATFIELKENQVSLKKKQDGKVISLPLDKLSKADQDFVKSLGKPESVNPFE